MRAGLAVVWRDLVLLMLLGFVCVVILLLNWVNPQAKPDQARSPGNLTLQVFWPDAWDVDVDTWVQAPGERPVGFSNKNGRYWNLLRDDLGQEGDSTRRNFEFVYSRGVPPGEYIVNIMLYRYHDHRGQPVPVDVFLSEHKPGMGERQLLEKHLTLRHEGEEVTVWRLRLDEGGRIVYGSVGDLFMPLAQVRK